MKIECGRWGRDRVAGMDGESTQTTWMTIARHAAKGNADVGQKVENLRVK